MFRDNVWLWVKLLTTNFRTIKTKNLRTSRDIAPLRLRLHGTAPEPSRTEPDLFTWNHLEPIQVFTRDRSGTGPERIHNWTCKIAGPVLDPFRTGSRTVPFKQKAYPGRKSDRIRSGPVPCKHILRENKRKPSGFR